MLSPTSSRRAPLGPALGLGLLLAARFALGVGYSLVIPPWESFDEPGHFQYARYIAVTGHLLDPNDPEAERIWSRFQPPLYYLLVAPILTFFDLHGGVVEPDRNPFLGDGSTGLNVVVASANPDALIIATENALLAGRLFGVIVSTSSAIGMYLAARRLWPDRPGLTLAVTSLYAFWPQIVFLGSVMTNDLLVISLGPVLLYAIVRIRQEGITPGNTALLALTVGAAILTKLNGLAFVVPAGLAILIGLPTRIVTHRSWVAPVIVLSLSALALAVVGSMDFVTEQVLSIDTLDRFWRNFQTTDLSAARLGELASYSRRTFTASYGWGKFETWSFVYSLVEGGALVAVVGCLSLAFTRRRLIATQPGVILLIAASLPLSLIVMAFALTIAQSDAQLMVGRYFLPALPGMVMMAAMGWLALLPRRLGGHVVALIAIAGIQFSMMAPAGILIPVYALPQTAPASLTSALATKVDVVFAPGMRLIGARATDVDTPGSPLAITLCWQADKSIEHNYPLRLSVVGPNGQGYGHYIAYPGRGNYPTSLWDVGRPFCEDYVFSVRGDYPAPAEGLLEISFLESPTDPREVGAATLEGVPLATSPTVPIVVHGRAEALVSDPEVPLDIRFGSSIALEGYSVQVAGDRQQLTVTLYWRCLAPVTEDLNVFAHLRTTPTTVLAQDDSRPREDRYPTTHWRPGELILDTRTFAIDLDQAPPLTLYLGLYTPEIRLPASASGSPLPDNEFSAPIWPVR